MNISLPSALVSSAVTLACICTAYAQTCPPGTPSPFPGVGSDAFTSKGIFKVSLSPALGGGTFVIKVQDPSTKILRSAPHLDGGAGGDTSGPLGNGNSGCAGDPQPGTSTAQIGFHPPGYNLGGGIDEVHTEIRCMNMTNADGWAIRAGAFALTQPRSLGEVESRAHPTCKGFPADSFFNLFLEVQTPAAMPFNGMLLTNRSALQVERKGIVAFPPIGDNYLHSFSVAGKTPLFVNMGGGNFCFVGWLEQGSHGVGNQDPCLRTPSPLFPIVISVDAQAEGLRVPDPCNPFGVPSPNDVFTFGVANGGGQTEADLFQSSGANLGGRPDITNARRIPKARMGLAGADNLDALSFGKDGGNILLFSVSPSSVGLGGTAVNFHSTLIPPGAAIHGNPLTTPSNGGGDPGDAAAGDIYVSGAFGAGFGGAGGPPLPGLSAAAALGTNELVYDELLLGLQAPRIAHSAGFGAAEDDTDALEADNAIRVDANNDQTPGDGVGGGYAPVFFSLRTGSPSLAGARTPDDIMLSPPPGGPVMTFAIFADGVNNIGLLAGDDLDALALFDVAPIGVLNAGDVALFSLRPGSPSLNAGANASMPGGVGGGPYSPAAVFSTAFAGAGVATIGTYATAAQMGLAGTDDVDALDCVGAVPFDNCPCVDNPDQADCDGDGVGDPCDTNPQVYDPAQQDTNSNGIPDECDHACCFSNGNCTVLLPSVCASQLGQLRALGTNCGTVTCVPFDPVPTLSQWGLIIMALLLLTAATIIITRRRPASNTA